MTRLKAEQILLLNLEQKIPDHTLVYCLSEQAHSELKGMTGQDFGYDVKAWKQWFKDQKSKKKKQD
jgi:N6-adenosine-specific RNA methylase IME4